MTSAAILLLSALPGAAAEHRGVNCASTAVSSSDSSSYKHWIEFSTDLETWWDNRCRSGILLDRQGVRGTGFESKSEERRAVSRILAAIKRTRGLENGSKLHKDAVAAGLHTNAFVAAALIGMYSKCRDMASARQVFDETTHRDAAMWNTLILGYARNGQSSVAMDLFACMDCKPDSFTYVAALTACGSLASEQESDKQVCLQKGIAIHKQLSEHGFHFNPVMGSSLVSMYSNCGCMDRAREVFDRMVLKNAVTWNSLILGYVQNGQSSIAMQLLTSMDCKWDSFIYLAALKVCGALASEDESQKQFCLKTGVHIHKEIVDCGLHFNDHLQSALVDMYCKCGSMDLAKEVFDRSKFKNVFTWTSLIQGYVQNGKSLVAMDLFANMDCEPSSVTYIAALKACGTMAGKDKSDKQYFLERGMSIHKRIRDGGFECTMKVATALVDMYSKCGSMDRAREVFDRMAYRNVITWNSIMLGYIQHGNSLIALDLFAVMDCEPDGFTYVAVLKACGLLAAEKGSEKQVYLEKGIAIHKRIKSTGLDTDMILASTLVDMYGKCGNMVLAKEVFDGMKSKDVVTWTSVIVGYVQNGEHLAALELFTAVDCEPDSHTYAAALTACGSLAAVAPGQQIHARICQVGLEQDQVVVNALMDYYAKCGRAVTAEELFSNMPYANLISYTTLIAGYSFCGDLSRVFSLMKKMQEAGLQLDAIAFICILSACSHAGLVDQAKLYFESMRKCGISPSLKHYNCLIDVLGRANRLEEALALVNRMPFEADAETWMTLLGACRKWKTLEVGRAAFGALVAMGAATGAAYVLMSDIYKSLNMVEDLKQMDVSQEELGPAWWCDRSGKTVEFDVGGEIEVEAMEKLRRVLSGNLVSGHSEELAIGHALVHTSPGEALHVVTDNLVCSRCHFAAKQVSKVENREIVLRDSSRFHIFRNGSCSCGDDW